MLTRSYINSFFNDFDMSTTAYVRFRKVKDDYLLTFDMPGVEKKDIQTRIENSFIKLEAKRFIDGEVVKEYDDLYKLPSYVDKKDVDASFENGVLTLTFKEDESHVTNVKIK
jgi:HSP20 family molecular chaperone IbpA